MFSLLQDRLVLHLRNRVRAGELTERGLARLTGLSQPHMHNVLKGIRSLSPEYADQIVEHLNLSISELLTGPELGITPALTDRETTFVEFLKGKVGPSCILEGRDRSLPPYPVPRSLTEQLIRPVMVVLAHDAAVYPYFASGDLALVDCRSTKREELHATALYLVKTENGTLVRSLREGGSRLYLLTPKNVHEPRKWEAISTRDSDFSLMVRGRVAWIGRSLQDRKDPSSIQDVRESR